MDGLLFAIAGQCNATQYFDVKSQGNGSYSLTVAMGTAEAQTKLAALLRSEAGAWLGKADITDPASLLVYAYGMQSEVVKYSPLKLLGEKRAASSAELLLSVMPWCFIFATLATLVHLRYYGWRRCQDAICYNFVTAAIIGYNHRFV